MRVLGSVLLCGLVLSPAAAQAAPSVPEQALAEPFSVAPAALLAHAQAGAPPSDDPTADPAPRALPLRMLVDARTVTIFDDHRVQHDRHSVIVVDDAMAVPWFRDLEVRWSPWLEDRPDIRARVIRPDGTEAWIQEDQWVVGGTRQGQDAVYTTDQALTAPLAGVEVGAIIEQEVIRHPREALSPVAAGFSWRPSALVRGGISRLVVTHPADERLAMTLPPDAPRARKSKGDGTVSLRWELAVPATAEDEAPAGQRDPDVAPRFDDWGFSLGGSWAAVTRHYLSRVADRQDPAGTEALVAGLAALPDRRARIAAAVDRVRDTVDYVGLEFGESAVVPYAPAVVVDRGFGDCKDQSNLLVTVLAEAGIPARLALVATDHPDPIRAAHPSLSAFDHAIVYLPEDELWIDPTATWSGIDSVPAHLAGHQALVIDAETTGLRQLPDHDTSTHGIVETRETWIGAGQPGRYTETVEARGFLAASIAGAYFSRSDTPELAGLRSYAEATYGDDAPALEVVAARAGDGLTRIALSGTAPRLSVWDAGHTQVAPVSVVLEQLPDWLHDPRDIDVEEGEVWSSWPHSVEVRETVHLPPGHAPTTALETVRVPLGDAAIERTARWDAAADTLHLTLRFDTGDGRFTAAEAQQLRTWARTGVPALPPIVVDDPGRDLLAAERIVEAMAHYNALVAAHPDAPWLRMRRAHALQLGRLGALAREEARAAVALDPAIAAAWIDLGYLELIDDLGEEDLERGDLEAARAAFEAAHARDPDDPEPLRVLAVLARPLPNLDLDRAQAPAAVAAWDRWAAVVPDAAPTLRMLEDLFEAGAHARVVELTGPDSIAEARALGVAARMADQGVEAGLALLAEREGDRETATAVVGDAYGRLMRIQDYPTARALVAARPDIMNDPLVARRIQELLGGYGRWQERLTEPEKDPELVLFGELLARLAGRPSDLLAPELVAHPAETAAYFDALRVAVRDKGASADNFVDNLLFTTTRSTADAAGTGLRVRYTATDGAVFQAYLRKKGRRHQLLAVDGDPRQLARQVLLHDGKGREEAAAVWMDWLGGEVFVSFKDRTMRMSEVLALAEATASRPAVARQLTAAAVLVDEPAAQELLGRELGALHETAPQAAQGFAVVVASRCLSVGSRDCGEGVFAAGLAPLLAASEVGERVRLSLLSDVDPEGMIEELESLEAPSAEQWRWGAAAYSRLDRVDEALAAHDKARAAGDAGLDGPVEALLRISAGMAVDEAVPLLGGQVSGTDLGRFCQATVLAMSGDLATTRALLARQWSQRDREGLADLPTGWMGVVGLMADAYGMPEAAQRYYAELDGTSSDRALRRFIETHGPAR